MNTLKPNIIVILADDMGYGDLACYGSTTIKTPRLDEMAEKGLLFTDFHSNGTVCSPTRAAFMTGRYQQRCGIEGVITAAGHRDVGMPLSEVTFAHVLKDAGYRTAIYGKWHLGYEEKFGPTHRGFDEFRGFVSGNVDYRSHIDQAGYRDWWIGPELRQEEGYTTDLVTEHGLRFIREHHDEPFCLYLAHECPHYPYQGPCDPAFRSEGAAGEPHIGPREDKEQAYVEMIESMDAAIGHIIDEVHAYGIAEQTLILFYSDNGPAGYGSAGEWRGGKGTVWEGGHRIPAIAYRPGTIQPGRTDETAISMDLFPTFAAMAGADPSTYLPEGCSLDGLDLTGLMTEGAPLPPRTLFWRHGRQVAARKGKWKMVVNRGFDPTNDKARNSSTSASENARRVPTAEVELYDLDADPTESSNLAETETDTRDQLLAEIEAWEADVSSGVERKS
jgi:arylsulfatase A